MFLYPTSLHSKIILNVGNYGFFVLTDRYYRGQLFCHPTLYVLPPLLQVSLEAESVVAAEPEAAVSVAAEPVFFVAVVSELRVSVDIPVAFAVLVPVDVVATPGCEGGPALTAVAAPQVEKLPARPSAGASALAASGLVALEHLEGDLDRGVVFGDLGVRADLGRPGLHVGADQLAQRLGGRLDGIVYRVLPAVLRGADDLDDLNGCHMPSLCRTKK